MNILILYGTTEGQTRKIAGYIQDVLKQADHTVTLADASDNPPAPADFDAVIIGASIHMHHYQSSVMHYLCAYSDSLNQKPTAFYSVCLAVASDIPEEHREAEKIAEDFIAYTGWNPFMIAHIAGALKYTQYDFMKRWIMKMISKREGRITDTSQDFEFTDWNQVQKFAAKFEGLAKEMNDSSKRKVLQGL